ncbi:MAG: hypothetical protein V3U65_18820 [Granulosicoccaceae bacterium]
MSDQLTSNNKKHSAQPFNSVAPLGSLLSFESDTLLKACVAPAVAIAHYQQALQWSNVAVPFNSWVSVLEAVGTQQLSGTPVAAADLLQTGRSKDNAPIYRLLELLGAPDANYSTQNVDATVALHIANAINPREVSLRRRAANQGELAGLPEEYVPPTGAERLQLLLDDWQQFVGRGAADMNPLLLIGLAHCQFICIRPFTFSNTATAQVLNQIMLAEEGVLNKGSVLPLAWQFSHRATDYWQMQIKAVREQCWEPWLLFFLQKITDCADRCTNQLHLLEQLRSKLLIKIDEHLPGTSNAQTLATICAHPSCGISDVVDAGVAKRQTAASYLGRLAQAGVLRECRFGKEKRFVNDGVLALLLDDI